MYTTAIFIAVITGLVEVARRAFKLDESFLPLLSVLLGVGIAFLGQDLVQAISNTIPEIILFGIILGLSASGLLAGFNSIASVVKRTSSKTSEKNVKE